MRPSLASPPLRWRRSAKLALPGLTLLAATVFALFVASMREVAHTVPEVLSEPKRWAAARPVPVRGAPAVVINSRSVVHDYLSNVQVSWQSLEQGANDTLTSLSYGVVWVPALQGPVEVRADGQGYLTNLGPQLAKPRLLNAAGTALFMSGLAGLAAWAVAKAWHNAARTKASRRLLLERPKQLFVPLREQQVLTQYGVATGHRTYIFEAPSGKLIKETFGAWRRAVFDEGGERVLVVMPEGDENAEPVLVADDGYPFAFERTP